MFRDKKLTIAIIIVLMISVIGLGIAFAAFSQTLTINGTGTVESSSWSVVFEGADGSNTIGAPTLVGTAQEITRPTIKNNSTEVSTYEVTLKSPGDEVIYNFKIHNKGDYAANLTSLTVAGVNKPTSYVSGSKIITNYSSLSGNAKSAADAMRYVFYYTNDNSIVGNNPASDCLEPGESVNVSLKIQFATVTYTNTGILPKTDLLLDNLGISATYTQSNNGSCAVDPISNYTGSFINYDYAYYTYEGKTFKGTGVNNVIIAEHIIGKAKYASTKPGTDNGAGANPRYTFTDHPAQDMAGAYCTGCRLMTKAEALSWGCPTEYVSSYTKCSDDPSYSWLLADASDANGSWYIGWNGRILDGYTVTINTDVRPAVSIPEGATMTGSGTQQDPYVITVN